MTETVARAAGRLEAEVITGARGFAALEEGWSELYDSCPSATPFQSWAWLYSWWEHYGDGRGLRVLAIRDPEGLLVGLFPLYLERRLGLPGRLSFIGTGSTDYLDLLAREGWEEPVVGAGLAAVEAMGGWAVADLREIRPGALARSLEAGWKGPKSGVEQGRCPLTDVASWEEMVSRLKPKRRSSVRQALRRADEDGLRRRLAGPEEAERAARRLVALHRESWRGRGIGVEHASPRFEAFVASAAGRMTERGLGVVSEFRRGDEAFVSHFLILGRDFVGGYMLGADEGTSRRFQFSSLCMWDAANVARERGLPVVDHLRGEEPYKVRWSTRMASNRRVVLARNPAVLAAYDAYGDLRSKAEAYAGSETAPRWLRRAVTSYRGLRSARNAGGRHR